MLEKMQDDSGEERSPRPNYRDILCHSARKFIFIFKAIGYDLRYAYAYVCVCGYICTCERHTHRERVRARVREREREKESELSCALRSFWVSYGAWMEKGGRCGEATGPWFASLLHRTAVFQHSYWADLWTLMLSSTCSTAAPTRDL